MFEVVNKDRHISSDVAETCIKIGGVIDKVFCGNGFTTAYSNIINNTELARRFNSSEYFNCSR